MYLQRRETTASNWMFGASRFGTSIPSTWSGISVRGISQLSTKSGCPSLNKLKEIDLKWCTLQANSSIHCIYLPLENFSCSYPISSTLISVSSYRELNDANTLRRSQSSLAWWTSTRKKPSKLPSVWKLKKMWNYHECCSCGSLNRLSCIYHLPIQKRANVKVKRGTNIYHQIKYPAFISVRSKWYSEFFVKWFSSEFVLTNGFCRESNLNPISCRKHHVPVHYLRWYGVFSNDFRISVNIMCETSEARMTYQLMLACNRYKQGTLLNIEPLPLDFEEL